MASFDWELAGEVPGRGKCVSGGPCSRWCRRGGGFVFGGEERKGKARSRRAYAGVQPRANKRGRAWGLVWFKPTEIAAAVGPGGAC